jgi:hypothetical protein
MSKNRLMTRRNVLWLGLGTVASMGAVANSKEMYKNQKIQSLYNPKRNFAVVGEASLKQRALDKKLIYGAAALYKDLSTQTELPLALLKNVECLSQNGNLSGLLAMHSFVLVQINLTFLQQIGWLILPRLMDCCFEDIL